MQLRSTAPKLFFYLTALTFTEVSLSVRIRTYVVASLPSFQISETADPCVVSSSDRQYSCGDYSQPRWKLQYGRGGSIHPLFIYTDTVCSRGGDKLQSHIPFW